MKDYFAEALKTSIQLIKIPSEKGRASSGKPFGNDVYQCLELTLNKAKELGFDAHNLEGYVGYCDVGKGDMFGILGHLDVVPLGKGWTYNQGEIVDDVLYGRGSVDDKTPTILCLYATKQLIDEGYTPKRTIRFIFGCNEESGWACIDKYRELEEMPREGFSPDADFPVITREKGITHFYARTENNIPELISLHGGEAVNMVAPSAVMELRFKDGNKQARCFESAVERGLTVTQSKGVLTISASGRAAHGSKPELGDNAITKLLSLLSEQFGGNVSELFELFGAIDGSGVGLNISDEPSGALTMNIGVARLNNELIQLEIDVRYPVTYKREFIYHRMDTSLKNCSVLMKSDQPPLFVSNDCELVTELLGAYNEVTGEEAKPISIGGGTYARALPVGVAFGPEFSDGDYHIHDVDEHISIADLKKAYEIYYEAIKRLCFTGVPKRKKASVVEKPAVEIPVVEVEEEPKTEVEDDTEFVEIVAADADMETAPEQTSETEEESFFDDEVVAELQAAEEQEESPIEDIVTELEEG